jgi:hypothetical protein
MFSGDSMTKYLLGLLAFFQFAVPLHTGAPASAPSASAFVQGFTAPPFTFTSPSILGSFITTTAGNAIIVVVVAGNGFGSPVISDTQGNSFSAIESNTSCLAAGSECYIVSAAFNIVGGADTISISWTVGNSNSSSSAAEYACTATCGIDVHTSTLINPWVNPSTVGPITATVSDIALTVVIANTSAGGTSFTDATISGGYTAHNGVNDNNTTGRGSKIADKNIAAGSFSATWSIAGAPVGAWLVLIGIHQ